MSFRLDTTGVAGSVEKYHHVALSLGGFLYQIGGFDSGHAALDEVWLSEINDDGTATAGGATDPLPAARGAHTAVVVHRNADGKDYIVVCGGRTQYTGGTVENEVYYATPEADGELTWSTAAELMPTARYGHVCAVIGERLFLVAGSSTAGGTAVHTVHTNTIDGIIAGDAWEALGSDSDFDLVAGGIVLCSGQASGRVIHILGGQLADGVGGPYQLAWKGIVTEVGGATAITWSELGFALGGPTAEHDSFIFDNCVYIVGGWFGTGDPNRDVWRLPILGDGSLGDPQAVGLVETSQNFGRGRAALMLGNPAHKIWVSGGRGSSIVNTAYWEDTPTVWKLAEHQDKKVGYARKLHIFYDGSIQHRYSDKAFGAGTPAGGSYFNDPDHEQLIVSVSNVQRGLGTDHFPQAADVEIVLDNRDGDADWLVDQDTAADVHKAICRLFVGAYETETPGLVAWQQLGEYYIASKPIRTRETVSFGITENIRGLLVDLSPLPTVQDWLDSGNSPFTELLYGFYTVVPEYLSQEDLKRVIPLRFGREYISEKAIFYTLGFWQSVHVLSASLSSETPEILKHWVVMPSGFVCEVPQTVPEIPGTNIWEAETHGPVTKNGVDYYIHCIKMSHLAYSYISSRERNAEWNPNWTYVNDDKAASRFIAIAAPLASTAEEVDETAQTSPAQVIRDIICNYSLAGASYLNEESLLRLEQTVLKGKYVAGSVGGEAKVSDVLGKLLGSWDIDGFTDYCGRFAVTAFIQDYDNKAEETTSLYEIDETDLIDFSDQHPSRGQRWSLFNRIYYDGIKEKLLVTPAVLEGPYDKTDTLLGASNFVERRLDVSWRTVEDAAAGPWGTRDIDVIPRPVARFRTHLGILRLDLGSYFRLSWTRNLGGPYDSALFKLEELDIDLGSYTVEVTAVWVADVDTNRPFLLDEQQYLTRVDSVGTATVVDSDATVEFSNATVLTDNNVAAGDHLILRDTTEATGGTARNRALKIQSVTDGNTLELDGASDLDFDAGAGVAVAAWEIRRSHLTPPTTGLPNYPDGTDIYGKISDGADPPLYSDAEEAHLLKDG